VSSGDGLPAGRRPEPGTFDISLVALVNVVLRHWRMLVVVPLVTAVLAGAFTYFFPTYQAESQFAPNQDTSTDSRLAGIAAQFGFSLPTTDEAESIDFYGQLLASREILTEAVQTEYHFEVDPDSHDSLSGNYIKLYGIDESTPEKTLAKAVSHLTSRVTIQKDAASGTVTLQTSAKWAPLAELLNRRLLDLISDFDLVKRQSSARAERQFIEGRLADTKAELSQYEDDMMRFLEKNRTYTDSPRLKFDSDRLQAQVDLHRQVVLTLAQSYEQARINEVRNTPVLTYIDRPEGSALPERTLLLSVALGGIVGVMLAGLIMAVREYLAREREAAPAGYDEFTRLRQDALRDLRAMSRKLIRRKQPAAAASESPRVLTGPPRP
jgi:uncharacterized protein involved in exopolysaccharide biosynthesis